MLIYPSQVALLLGALQRDILEWVMSGELKASKLGKQMLIDDSDLVSFLKDHPENVGRVYCDDIPGWISNYRKSIVERLEM